jgi:hypothetical protein
VGSPICVSVPYLRELNAVITESTVRGFEPAETGIVRCGVSGPGRLSAFGVCPYECATCTWCRCSERHGKRIGNGQREVVTSRKPVKPALAELLFDLADTLCQLRELRARRGHGRR